MNKRVIQWVKRLKKDYFNSFLNSVISVFFLFLFAKLIIWLANWAILDAVWVADSINSADSGTGANWAFIIHKIRFFLFGFYPKEEIWRICVAMGIIISSVIPYFIKSIKHKIFIFASHLLLWPLVIYLFLSGGFLFDNVSTNDWGGLTLTLVLSLLGLLFSFPLGIFLALARRSTWPVIRGLAITYIEFFRGIPLITILFMSSVVVPFFLPEEMAVDKIIRVVVGMTFFQSAYVAEVVRGGLQTIPKGQYEAADSLGFKFSLQSYLIILPQVLKITISNIGGISISFVKDTTLVLIIGMFDLLGIVNPLASDGDWLGMEPEGLIFAGIVYWIICFFISRTTYRLERRMNTLAVGRSKE